MGTSVIQTPPDIYLIHVAGPVLHASGGSQAIVRQRCAWCGALLIDDNLPVEQGFKFTFTAQSQVAVSGGCAWTVPGDVPGPQSCLYLDPAVTR